MSRNDCPSGDDEAAPTALQPVRVGEIVDVDGLGPITIDRVTQRNWSRVALGHRGDERFFVKQFVDRVGGRHDRGYDGDRRSQELLGDEVLPGVRVVPVAGRVPDRLITVNPHIDMTTIDSINQAWPRHREPASKVGEALAQILRDRTVAADPNKISVWKGLDPKNVGWTPEGDLWVFDFGPPKVLSRSAAAARVMAAGLLSRWVARPGLHLVWPERSILRGVCEPIAEFTTFEAVDRELAHHAALRLREPQRVGLAAAATRLGLRTLGRIHWAAVEREARRLFRDT